MNFFDMNSEVCNLRGEEERILASFTRRLIEIAGVAGGHGSASAPTAALDVMRLPAIALDQDGFVADVNAAAEAIFDTDVKIKDRRLFVRDAAARVLLNEAIDHVKTSPPLGPLPTGPIIVQRQDKLPVIVRIWRFGGAAPLPELQAEAPEADRLVCTATRPFLRQIKALGVACFLRRPPWSCDSDT